MTRKEIIEFCEMKAELEVENEDIYETIIKALEHEAILDKIRAEIMSKDGLEEALEIIDKYKAESEGEE